MQEIINNIDWMALITSLWTIVLVPIGKQVYDCLKTKKVDKYAKILYDEVVKAVKAVWEAEIKDIKGTEDWTTEKQWSVREIAKIKALNAISNSACQMLRTAYSDFDEWLDSMIDTALYDVKHE